MESGIEPIITVTPQRPMPGRANPADGGPPLSDTDAVPMAATYSFDDLLTGLNPLHHLPVVGTIYRAVTGETVPAAERIATSLLSGALFGGPLGVLATVVGCFVEDLIQRGPDPRAPKWGEVAPTAELRPGAFDSLGSG